MNSVLETALRWNRTARPIMIRRAMTLVGIFLVCGAATGAWASAVAEESAPVTIRYPQSVSSIPVLALVEDYPEEYSGEFFADHPQALAQLITGETDLLVTGFSVGYSRSQAAGDLVHIATPVWGASAIMVRPDISDIGELAGGTIYAPFEGSPIDLTLRAILQRAGLGDEVEIAYAPFPQAVAILVQGNAEAAVLVEPLASKLEIDGSAHRLMNLTDGWAEVTGGEPRSPQVSVFARRDWARNQPVEVARFTERLADYVEALRDDPAAWALRYAPVLGFPAAVVERAIRNTWFETPGTKTTRQIITVYTRELSLTPPDQAFFTLSE